jgi:D-tyrosyl-tRNA(Tyr) deacylase
MSVSDRGARGTDAAGFFVCGEHGLMRVVVQRVASASVEVDGKVVGVIGPGLLVLAGFEESDGEEDLAWMSGKLSRLRIFDDENGTMNRSVVDTGGDVLAVSQFTLFASVRKGNRPSWSRAAVPGVARPLFERFARRLETELGRPVPTGVFGADMTVRLVNDGPVTLFIDSAERSRGKP